MRAKKDASDTIAEAWSKDIRECARLEGRCEQLTKEVTALKDAAIKSRARLEALVKRYKELSVKLSDHYDYGERGGWQAYVYEKVSQEILAALNEGSA